MPTHPRRPRGATALAAVALAALALGGCAHQAHDPRPLDPAAQQEDWLAARGDDAALREALARQGVDVSAWPLPAWSAEALDALALARHPDLDVARAELRVAEAAHAAARERAGRTVEAGLEHHSADGEVDAPWSVTLAVDALLGGGARRSAQADEADALALEARHAAAEAAWKLRQRVREARRARHFDALRADAAQAAWDVRRELAAAQRRRLERGAADAAEALRAGQDEADAAQQAAQAREALQAARAALAGALALPLEAADALPLDFADLQREPPEAGRAELQRAALLDRLDLRAALARYAAADAALRAEIARQWPELTLRPGLAWDQGDRIWSLGLALALPPGGDNRAAIEQARARRELEAARCRALQSATLASLDAAHQAAAAAAETERAAESRRAAAREAGARAERRFAAGDADRPELLAARAGETEAQLRWIEARAARWAASERLEDVVQRPLAGLPAASAGAGPSAAASARAARASRDPSPAGIRPRSAVPDGGSAPAPRPTAGRAPSPDAVGASREVADASRQAAPPYRDAGPSSDAAPPRDVVPSRDTAPSRDTVPSRAAVPSREAGPSRNAGPSWDAPPSADAAPSGGAAPSRDAASSDAEAPDGAGGAHDDRAFRATPLGPRSAFAARDAAPPPVLLSSAP